MNKTKNLTAKIAVTAVLSAIIAIVSFIPLKTLGLEITFSMVPIAVGAIIYGPAVGAVLGAVFGIVSFLQCFGYSAFGALLLSESPLLAFVVCVPTRILAGFLTGLISYALRNGKAQNEIRFILCSLLAPLFNTIFFMTALVIGFYNGKTVQGFVEMLGAANPFTFVIMFVGINGLVEIAAGFAVAYPVSRGVYAGIKKYL